MNKGDTSVAHSRRITIRPLTEGAPLLRDRTDHSLVRRISGLEGVLPFLPETEDAVVAQFLIENSIDRSDIGFCSFSRIPDAPDTLQADVHSVGGENQVGLGFEASMVCVNHAFTRYGADRILMWSGSTEAGETKARGGVLQEVSEIPAGMSDVEKTTGARLFTVDRARWERYGAKFLKMLERRPGA